MAATVSEYILTGEPVSSQELAGKFSLSSATIRNILSELENEGFLYHPYTSAGRVPTSKCYRYYVKYLMSRAGLSEQEKNEIIKELKSINLSADDTLEAASELVASITHYASIVSFSRWKDKMLYKGLSNIIAQPEFRDVYKLSCLIKLLEEKQRLLDIINREFDEPLRVYIGEEIGCPDINDVCSLVVSTYRVGKSDKGKIAVLGPCRMSYEQIMPSLEFISGALSELFYAEL